ncbi:type IV secretion protein Rhs [Intestinirhabdus alba]|jgi:hypothetical protein|uniref:Type IV secretion protein Rhs n=1 Tax=Intestinirhabdus alba TaxID=2899544 RepID=A0A6L6ISD1_9ENTR|nr:type IV secretion protein Rhs [Intestinirhabdus alba]MTH48884.1 type IV secretion protein Rhs [Intestinirhabdus alba]
MTEKRDDKLKDGGLRRLTAGEIQLAQSVFISTIAYHKVWIHKGSYLPLNLQNEYAVMTPNGELYFRYWYRDDFSQETVDLQHLFIHEMGHVWQREKGVNIIGRGLVSWAVSYSYTLDGRLLSEYPMEQQAQIIADNFVLQKLGYKEWERLRMKHQPEVTYRGEASEPVIRQLYRNALRGFPW